MTEKRFIGCFEGDMLVSIKDTVTDRQLNILQIVEIANKIYDENEQLKQAYQTLKSRHSLLHDECLEAECDRDSLKKDVISLEKENENLNNVLEDFMVMLNRLQAEPNNKSLQGMARDMLQMMGKNIMGDSDD